MAEYTLSAIAVDDLKEMFLYGCREFGENQATHYHHGILSQFDLLAKFPGLGLPVDILEHDLFHFGYGMHVIIYSKTDTGVSIEFLFDGRMEWLRHLSRS